MTVANTAPIGEDDREALIAKRLALKEAEDAAEAEDLKKYAATPAEVEQIVKDLHDGNQGPMLDVPMKLRHELKRATLRYCSHPTLGKLDALAKACDAIAGLTKLAEGEDDRLETMKDDRVLAIAVHRRINARADARDVANARTAGMSPTDRKAAVKREQEKAASELQAEHDGKGKKVEEVKETDPKG